VPTVCTFCGYSRLYDGEVGERTEKIIEDLIVNKGVDTFYVGNYGAFDRLCAGKIKRMRKKYAVKVFLVPAYYKTTVDDTTKAYYNSFDGVILADTMHVPYRAKIIECNRFMVDSAEYVVAYVTNDFSNAVKTLEYAEQKKKKIIMVQAGSMTAKGEIQ